MAATNQGNPGNPAGLMVPAFNSSFAFFQVFMGTSVHKGHFLRLRDVQVIELCRVGLPDLLDLLAPDQCRLLYDLLHAGLRIRLPCGSLL